MVKAQHAHATDRFALEIRAIFKVQLALAAADAQAVRLLCSVGDFDKVGFPANNLFV